MSGRKLLDHTTYVEGCNTVSGVRVKPSKSPKMHAQFHASRSRYIQNVGTNLRDQTASKCVIKKCIVLMVCYTYCQLLYIELFKHVFSEILYEDRQILDVRDINASLK